VSQATRRAFLGSGALLAAGFSARGTAYANTPHGNRDLHVRQSRFSSGESRGASIHHWGERGDHKLTALDTLLEHEAGVYGLMVVDQQGLLRYSRNARLPFISASLYKLLLCADILRRIEAENLAFDDMVYLDSSYFIASQMPDGGYDYDAVGTEISIDEAIWSTICVSSNVAAIALLGLTSTESMNDLGRELGMTSTSFASDLTRLDFWPPVSGESELDLSVATALIEELSLEWQINLTSPADMTLFMHNVMQEKLISPFVSSELSRLLFDQQINDRMPALLPAGTRAAHKTGNLSSIVHDAGAIVTSEGPFLLSMLSQAVPDEHHTTRLLQSIAAMIFAELERP